MKDNSVVLISMGGFLAITIKDALKERNVEVIDVKPSVEELEEHRAEIEVLAKKPYRGGTIPFMIPVEEVDEKDIVICEYPWW